MLTGNVAIIKPHAHVVDARLDRQERCTELTIALADDVARNCSVIHHYLQVPRTGLRRVDYTKLPHATEPKKTSRDHQKIRRGAKSTQQSIAKPSNNRL